MFPSVPPVLRVVSRHRRGVITGAGIVILLYYTIHHQIPSSILEVPRNITLIHSGYHFEPVCSTSAGNQTDEIYGPPIFLVSTSAGNITSRPIFSPGTPKPAGQAYTKALVVARTSVEDVAWIDEPLNLDGTGKTVAEEWAIHRYTTDDPILEPDLDPDINPGTSADRDRLRSTTTDFHTPLNKGREVMAYLTYIIDHYSRLADITVFMHAHRSSWHDNQFDLNAVATLSRLNLDRVARLGFVNLRCDWNPGCPEHIRPGTTEYDLFKPEQAIFARAWDELFPLEEMPEVLSQPCCAQFALTAERIRGRPLGMYVWVRDWVLMTELEDSISGRVLEYVYQYVFCIFYLALFALFLLSLVYFPVEQQKED